MFVCKGCPVFTMRCRWQSSIVRIATQRKSSTLAPVVLRPYQEHCLDACISALDSGSSRIGVSLPTGSGKTTVFISLLARLASPAINLEATKSIIIVNNIELARQSAIQVARLFPSWSVEIEQGSKYKASGLADVYVYSYLSSRLKQYVFTGRWLPTKHSTMKNALPSLTPEN